MTPEGRSVTGAFAVIFILMAAKAQWIQRFAGWVSSPVKKASGNG